MLELQHNVVSILYTIKGMIESHFGRNRDNLLGDKENVLKHAQETLESIYVQTDRALMITKHIGMTMKMAKDGDNRLECVSINAVWRDVTKIISAQYALSEYEMINHIPDKFPKIRCNRSDLTEILFCLVENAVQAMAMQSACPKRGKLIIRVNLGFRAGEEPIANITVADTGPGMPAETLHQLFEPFVTTKEPGQGNGLGLCLVKSLVRKNNGTISVSSFKDCGTTFALSFSVAKSSKYESANDFALTG